tara:strand:+ start:186 stop:404 length:219 start_codon:yes stop_codon:yes gene_type:complete
MNLGDYVGKINNKWIERNPFLSGTVIARDLFGEQKPEPMGVIVDFNGDCALVLKPDGTIEQISVALITEIKK